MKRITLAMLLAAAIAALPTAAMATAQNPAPPAPPARVTPAAPAPAAAPAPRPAMGFGIDEFDRLRFEDQARAAMDASRDALAASRYDLEGARLAQVRAAADMVREYAPLASMPALAPVPSFPPLPDIPSQAPRLSAAYGFDSRDAGFTFRSPPAPWAQGDPADSLYRGARDALNRGDYVRAARMFADIQQKYPKSAYVGDSQYYEAFARYRIGTTEELQAASKVLEPLANKMMNVNNNTTPRARAGGFGTGPGIAGNSETLALYAHINGVLAQRGDRSAADKIAKAATLNGSAICDNEDIQVRVEAMNALSQMDPAAAAPLFKRVLDRKDDCSSALRSRAVFMLGRRSDPESAQLLINAAKSDPSMNVRTEAINALPRLSGDVGLSALEEMLRTEQDERVQSTIVRALAASDNAKARSSMRALIDRNDAPVNMRIAAISSLNSDRATTDDAAYLRGLYGKTDNARVKEAIISAVGRMSGAENDKWVMSIAQNQSEPSELRAAAMSRVMRSNITVADLGKLYDASESNSIRQQIINVLATRKEPEATDKLIDIVKNSTVLPMRTAAINALARKNDPRAVKLLNDLLDGKAP